VFSVMGHLTEELTSRWSKLSLSEEEATGFIVHEEVLNEIVQRGQNCVVGKFFANRTLGKSTLRLILMGGWQPSGNLSIQSLGDNLFIMDFEYAWEKSRVLEGRPWVFDGTLFAVEDFDGTIPPTQMEFDKAAFWVRMFNLPLACMGRDLGIQLGGTVGEVEEVDTNEEGVAWGEFLRVRIRINLTKPIARGRVINVKGRSFKIPFQYERLPRICFQCGVIYHTGPVCSASGRGRIHGAIAEPQYGPWLWVSSNPSRPFTGYRGQRGEDEQSDV
jgi:hypothetical protein